MSSLYVFKDGLAKYFELRNNASSGVFGGSFEKVVVGVVVLCQVVSREEEGGGGGVVSRRDGDSFFS